MASHGVPRVATRERKTQAARERELKKIEEYKGLVDVVTAKVAAHDYSPELLQETAQLLQENPEYYTIWNHRRRIYANEFKSLRKSTTAGELTENDRGSQVLDVIQLDLQFLFPLLLKFPKCYWIWNHRLWLLEQATKELPTEDARKLWHEELGLVGKMLTRDSRNFHGWGYRRTIVEQLESKTLDGKSMSREELKYTTKKIEENLSNFSAWHNRSKLILKTLDEEQASDEERLTMLQEEFEYIHSALIDPYDQSLWFYHQSLRCCLDPDMTARTMTPNLTELQRKSILAAELEFIEELLEDAKDSKWVYQALIECTMLSAKLAGLMTEDRKDQILSWLGELKKLDTLRKGRWQDLERSLDV